MTPVITGACSPKGQRQSYPRVPWISTLPISTPSKLPLQLQSFLDTALCGTSSAADSPSTSATNCPKTQLCFWGNTMISKGKPLAGGMTDKTGETVQAPQGSMCICRNTSVPVLKTEHPAPQGSFSKSHTAEHSPQATSYPRPGGLHRESVSVPSFLPCSSTS